MSATHGSITQTLARRLDRLYEFDREPVSPDRLQGGRRFAAVFAGEHVAATEFVIGALFVSWGAGARDVILGLLVGNLLAVLSWTFICAPIATRVRLTLYWYARRIIGPGLSVIYNLVNAMLYCCLASAMIGVSASAVIQALNGIPGVHIAHPAMTDVSPPGIGWVLAVLLVGSVTVTLAILGFRKLAQFSSVCSPWMFLMFIAGALTSLPRLGDVHDLESLRTVAETRVWAERPLESPAFIDEVPPGFDVPLLAPIFARHGHAIDATAVLGRKQIEDGSEFYELVCGNRTYRLYEQEDRLIVRAVLPRLGLWHIVFFAWFCNLAMHVGLSDMALFRYARHWSYGLYSAFGMYLGHFLAWICAGIMGAALGRELNPGAMADLAIGVPGMLAVLLAGWTTTNPTIYRAGLALQIVTPDWPRWKITLLAGAVTTCLGFFPAIFMKLLDFVAIYGLVLMPVGAVIFTEHWIFHRLGLMPCWAQRRGRSFNPAAGLCWLVVLGMCFPFEQFTDGRLRSPMDLLGVHLFFRWLPGWFVAAILYTLLARWLGARPRPGELPVEEIPTGGPSSALRRSTSTVSPADARRGVDLTAWLAGAVSLLALAFCLHLPLMVFLGGPDPGVYEHQLALCKKGLIPATVVYFAAALVWAGRGEKGDSS